LPLYQLTDEKLWKDWSWSEKFPAGKEILSYFHYVDQKLDLRRDISFNTRVVGAQYDANEDRWVIRTQDQTIVRAKFFLLCTGVGAKPYTPPFEGLESFNGLTHHTAGWPRDGVDFEGKRVGIIGTGATGVQVTQEIGSLAAHLTVFQRTPNFALPMNQAVIDEKYQRTLKE
ncbi:hypothetical protein V5O48_019523, partial [Marasmius crinis-equi]